MKAIISGASSGIGKAIAIVLAKKGYDLILLARGEEALKKLVNEITSTNSNHHYIAIDLSKANEIKSMNKKLATFQSVDVLVNNLGAFKTNCASELKETELKQLLDTNLFSAINLTNIALPLLKKSSQPTIFNIGSVASLKTNKATVGYSISKHAFKAWNDGLREELRTQNIKVSCLYPGPVNTSSWDGVPADRENMIQTEDIAKIIGSLLDLGATSLVEEVRLSPLNMQG